MVLFSIFNRGVKHLKYIGVSITKCLNVMILTFIKYHKTIDKWFVCRFTVSRHLSERDGKKTATWQWMKWNEEKKICVFRLINVINNRMNLCYHRHIKFMITVCLLLFGFVVAAIWMHHQFVMLVIVPYFTFSVHISFRLSLFRHLAANVISTMCNCNHYKHTLHTLDII